MKRREFITLLASTLMTAPRGAVAQTPTKVYRLAPVGPGGPVAEAAPFARLLLNGLTPLGYTLGQNLVLQGPGAATGQPIQLAHLMEELKTSKVDVIVVFGYPTAVAAKAAGIPTVVGFGAGDPVATGLVLNLARPESNITGIS